MRASGLLPIAGCLCAVLSRAVAAAAVGARCDAVALVQDTVRVHHAGGVAEADDSREDPADDPAALFVQSVAPAQPVMEWRPNPSDAVTETKKGPIAETELGRVIGQHQKSVTKGGFHVFKGIPYGEPLRRFAAPEPKRPWGPALLEARSWASSCAGCGMEGKVETEDCLTLNLWLSPGGHKGMPVMVYLHGGMNQHGSADDPFRQGDLVVQSAQYPAIFVNVNFRLGIFGWIDMEDPAMPKNLGLRDQQLALRWVQRHIAAFGGDPNRVTVMGQSEGADVILAHMVSPASMGLFQRASLHSPPADFWSRQVNRLRTDYMLRRLGCERSIAEEKEAEEDGMEVKHSTAEEVIECLERHSAQSIWSADWIVEDLATQVGSPRWFGEIRDVAKFFPDKNLTNLPGYLGWHPVVDGDLVPGEPRELIAEGRYHKEVQVLVTTARNESYGAFPSTVVGDIHPMGRGLEYLLKPGDSQRIMGLYYESLQRSKLGRPQTEIDLMSMIITDKVWLCDIVALARDLAATGGDVRVGLFEHAPKWDPFGRLLSQLCVNGATCHTSDMGYMLPQDPDRGGIPLKKLPDEFAFAMRYRDAYLAFVSGEESIWVPFNASAEPITFTSADANRVVQGYRREQCELLDSSMGDALPEFMRKRSRRAPSDEQGLANRTEGPSSEG